MAIGRSRSVWKNPLGKSALAVIGIFALGSLLGYLITPDSTPSANSMNLALANAPMGITVSMARTQIDREPVSILELWMSGRRSEYREFPVAGWKQDGDVFSYREYMGFEVDPGEWTSLTEPVEVEQRTFILGTDKYGRDLLSRLILGGRVSIAVGFISVIISLFIGIPLGALAGYYGGWIDRAVMWLVNVMWSVPTLLMVIALTFVLGKGFWQVFVAVGLTMWVEVARVVRGQVMGISRLEFVDAARVLGFGSRRILTRHILPNTWAPVIVISAANFAAAILMESGLSFLGIGAQPPTPSWGGIIRDHYAYIITGEAHLSLLPGLCIMLLVLAFMVLGNVLRDALDVRAS